MVFIGYLRTVEDAAGVMRRSDGRPAPRELKLDVQRQFVAGRATLATMSMSVSLHGQKAFDSSRL